MKKFLEELQNSDEERKHRWFVGGVLVLGVFFFGLWVAYFSILLKGESEETEQVFVQTESETSEPSFLASIQNSLLGLQSSWQGFWEKVNVAPVVPASVPRPQE